MTKVHYEINVAYKGKHDYKVTVDRNGLENVTQGAAVFTKRTLQEALGRDYEVTMQRVETAVTSRRA